MNCKRHPHLPAFAMWPWKESDKLCEQCVYDAQAGAERLSERDRLKGPVISYGAAECAPDGRLIHNPNPAEKRFFND